VQIDGSNKGGLSELLEALLRNENRYISNIELRMMRQKYIIQSMALTARELSLILILMRKTWTLRLWDGKVLNRLNVLENRLRKTCI